ncbi:oxygenase MpaB family protein [Streptomyces laurentii]|uniref:oxygenase MpaB family protein n=1 Tax=Streptomyces laurentii TaxID=39478 RepID=UPI0033F71AFB
MRTPDGGATGHQPGDPGLFGPGSVTWQLHGDPVMWIGGVCALYLQALHPAADRNVVINSDFRRDAWSRLMRTARLVGTLTYGTAEAAGARVRRIHRLLGIDDPVLLWVHCAEIGSPTVYGFDAAKLRAARTAAGASVAHMAREVRVAERAVSLYLAGTRVPKPEVLPRLAKAVGVSPADLCTVEHERLVRLRVFAAAAAPRWHSGSASPKKTYRQLETTGRRGTLAHYDRARDEWIAWDDWAASSAAG